MTEQEMAKWNLIEYKDGEYMGKADKVALYLRYCLEETKTQYLANGYSWEETEPIISELYEYILMTEQQGASDHYIISENPMCASNILVKAFER